MSEAADDDSKTEQATEKKVNDSIERGQLPISREAPLLGFLGATLLICTLMLRDGVARLTEMLSRLLDNPGDWTFRNGADAAELLRTVLEHAATFIAPIFVVFIGAGLAVSFAQNMPRVVLSRIAPDLSKISPAAGLKRMFGTEGIVQLAKNCFKIFALGGIVVLVLNTQRETVLNALYADPSGIAEAMLGLFVRMLLGVCTAFVLLAMLDIVWSRVSWRKGLMMSRQEIKDEMRQAEGDPLQKARRRSLAMDRARRRMLKDVTRATMVIANPTHYAIALRYVRSETSAPIVIAKGQDLIALRIREIAEKSKIAVIEDKLLARSMYDHVEVSQAIPPQFYKAVAEIVHFIQARNTKKASADPTKVLR